jgi:hypothetical protein
VRGIDRSERLAGVGYLLAGVHLLTRGRANGLLHLKWKNSFAEAHSDLAGSRITRGKHTRNPPSRPTSKILCPAFDVCDPSDCRVAFISRGQPQEAARRVASDANAVQLWQLSLDTGNNTQTGSQWREPTPTRSMADLAICALQA